MYAGMNTNPLSVTVRRLHASVFLLSGCCQNRVQHTPVSSTWIIQLHVYVQLPSLCVQRMSVVNASVALSHRGVRGRREQQSERVKSSVQWASVKDQTIERTAKVVWQVWYMHVYMINMNPLGYLYGKTLKVDFKVRVWARGSLLCCGYRCRVGNWKFLTPHIKRAMSYHHLCPWVRHQTPGCCRETSPLISVLTVILDKSICFMSTDWFTAAWITAPQTASKTFQ